MMNIKAYLVCIPA